MIAMLHFAILAITTMFAAPLRLLFIGCCCRRPSR